MYTSINQGMFVKSIFEFIGISKLLIVIHQDNTQSIRMAYDTTETYFSQFIHHRHHVCIRLFLSCVPYYLFISMVIYTVIELN